jgi:hypothetical protein
MADAHVASWRRAVTAHRVIAGASPPEADPIVLDYIEDCERHARAAADFALRKKTGHTDCSPTCSGWHRFSTRSTSPAATA